MAYVFEASDGKKYVLADKPIVGEDEDGQLVVDVVPYVEPVESRAPVAPSASSPDATGDSDSPDNLATYYEHNGATPHADPAMRCGCSVCKAVDGRL